MTRTMYAVLPLLLAVSACDTGTYTPSAHSHASSDAMTGSRLSGADTDLSTAGSNDASLQGRTAGATGGAGGGAAGSSAGGGGL